MTDDKKMPKLQAMVDQIGGMIAGRAASDIPLANPAAQSGVIAVLPSWIWRIPKINVGRKGRTSDGDLVKMPARVIWSGGPVVVLEEGESREIGFTITALGHNESGHAVIVHNSADSGVQIALSTGEELSPVVRQFLTQRHFQRQVRAIVSEGIDARWGLVTSLEAFAKIKLDAANAIVAAELREYNNRDDFTWVLDPLSIEELLANMLYGDGNSSVITRMVDRSLEPQTFQRVDPMHWFAINIRARAEEEIRRKIGDPKIGPKVRRLFARNDFATLEEGVKEYRRLFPQDSLATKRAFAALTAGPIIATQQRQFHDAITGTERVSA